MSYKVNRKSASRWEQSAERALIEIWGEKMGDLRGCRKNSHILLEMQTELQVHGYTYTVPELKTKMHNMTARYRKEKRKMGITGGSPSEWDLFKEMELLLYPYKSYNCEGLVIDSITHINSTTVSQEPPSPLPLPSPTLPLPVKPSPLSSSVVPSPLPSPSTVEPSPLPSPANTQNSGSAAATSRAGTRKKCAESFFKIMENNLETMREEMKQTTDRVIAIEEEKKDILKAYIDREAEMQKALTEFLKRQ